MNTSHLSLSSPVFAGRVKKFDTYVHNSKKSQRNMVGSDVISFTPKESHTNSTGNYRIGFRDSDQRSSRNMLHRSSKVNVETKNDKTSVRPKDNASKISHLVLSTVARTNVLPSIADPVYELPVVATKRAMSKIQGSMYAVAFVVFMLAAATSIQTLVANKNNKDQIQNVLGESSALSSVDEQGVVQGSGGSPAEKEVTPSAIVNYRVSNPEHPRYLRIPALNVEARIKQLGEKDGAIDAPWNIYDVGWFDASAKPGDSRGSSLLLGHASGWTAPGVFKNLGKLNPADRFEVEKGSGEKVMYEVVRSRSVSVGEINMGKILRSEYEGEHDLKLMTCSGKYNRDTDSYEERMVVYAKIIR